MFFRKNKFLKLKKEAKYLLNLGHKVYHYRRDILSSEQVDDLLQALKSLKDVLLGEAVKEAPLKQANGRLDQVLRQCGGRMCPSSPFVKFLTENTELLLVAAILAIGIRTFFFQPFKIPTNSMFPTYNGMTATVFSEENPRPDGKLDRVLRKAFLWATPYKMIAPTEGELRIPLVIRTQNSERVEGQIPFQQIGERQLGILPVVRYQYTFWVGERPVHIKVPRDFTLERVILERFYPEYDSFRALLTDMYKAGRMRQTRYGWILETDKYFKKNQPILDFDILTGDMLFVERVSYHFRTPQIGDPIVFRTRNIPAIHSDKYYIKRLVGLGGDTLEVREPTLYRNGQPIEGAPAFEKNAQREGGYQGYKNIGRLAVGKVERIPEGYAYAMGDNSPNSSDSRYWGYVPQKDIMGRAFFIYYPFTHRWGIAR